VGKKPMAFRKFVVTLTTFYLFYNMQSVRAVQGCMAVLYEPANWCYVYIKNIIF